MQKYIKLRGEGITKDEVKHLKEPVLFTQELLKLRADVTDIIRVSFKNNPDFLDARDNALIELFYD